MNTARAPNHFSPGGLLDGGKYRIIRQLGAGGMGAVFEAENTLTRKHVAIKCLHAGRASHPDATARLLREAEAASRIRHPHVVDVYDVGHDRDNVFLVMEYLEGEPLSQLLARGGMPMHALIALLLPAMRAVAEAHRQGVVHRDIKPDNIFLARERDAHAPVPKVLDFGISKLSAHDGEQASLTLSGSTIGTPRYMAYEQLMSDKRIDGRVDVYAFGVILYEALTGRPPFDAETYPELIVKIAHGTMQSPKELRAELPSTLDRLVCWALERDRDQRIASIEELIRELEPFATERGMLAEMSLGEREGTPLSALAFNSTVRSKPPTRVDLPPPAAPAPAAPAPAPAPAQRRRAPWLLALSAIVLGVAWLLFDLYTRERVEESHNAVRAAPAASPESDELEQTPAPGRAPGPEHRNAKEHAPAPQSERAAEPEHGSAKERAPFERAPAPDHGSAIAPESRGHAPAPERDRANTPASERASPARESEGPPAARERATTNRGARRAVRSEPSRADGADDPPRARPSEEPPPSAASPPPPAAAPTPTTARTQDTPAPASSTFRVKLPQSKEF